jgi:[acyl-carrier-protein] S-malonyltransferase|tara:strand:+ start:4082 stop:5026 length:945 start_codon:yes stop_codon:yes gene_type:complete
LSITFVFPGQGAQVIGMGQTLARAYPNSRNVFEEVDDALNFKLSKLVWEGEIEELTLTENAQPALMATSIATLRAMEEEGISSDTVKYFAGHSLGEYSALCAAGALDLADTARLLRLRGKSMQKAVPIGVGAMAAILGLNFELVEKIAQEASQKQVCQAANDNDPNQVVISGNLEAVERAIILAKEKGAKRAIILPVSAPFHCELMQPASDVMAEAFSKVSFKIPSSPIVANYSALPVVDPTEIKNLLIKQITGRVRWRETINYMSQNGVDKVIEIGSGKALTGMIRRINKDINCYNIGSSDDLNKFLSTDSEG